MTIFSLKLIAMIAMTIDHAAKIIGQWGLLELGMSMHASYRLIHVMTTIGRIAFPLYAFMIAEGASKTRSLPKYIARLLLLAVISEPVFYFAFSRLEQTWSGFLASLSRGNLNNVFFTLALGAMAIFVYQKLEGKTVKQRWMVFLPASLLLLFASAYVGSDYGAMGVLLVIALYLAKTKKQKMAVLLVWSAALYLFGQGFNGMWSDSLLNCLLAALSGVLVWFYNGQRGRPVKWSFYFYYPIHLLVLMGLSGLV